MEIMSSRRDPSCKLETPWPNSSQLQVPPGPSCSLSDSRVFRHKIPFLPRRILGPFSLSKERGRPTFVSPQKVYHKIGPPGSKGNLSRGCPPRRLKCQVCLSSVFGTNLLNQTPTPQGLPSSSRTSSATPWALRPRGKRG